MKLYKMREGLTEFDLIIGDDLQTLISIYSEQKDKLENKLVQMLPEELRGFDSTKYSVKIYTDRLVSRLEVWVCVDFPERNWEVIIFNLDRSLGMKWARPVSDELYEFICSKYPNFLNW